MRNVSFKMYFGLHVLVMTPEVKESDRRPVLLKPRKLLPLVCCLNLAVRNSTDSDFSCVRAWEDGRALKA